MSIGDATAIYIQMCFTERGAQREINRLNKTHRLKWDEYFYIVKAQQNEK